MPVRASMPSTAPLTRRQIREAERRAAQAAIRESAARAASTLPGRHVATVPLDGTVALVGAADAHAHVATVPLDGTPATVTADAAPAAGAHIATVPLDGTAATVAVDVAPAAGAHAHIATVPLDGTPATVTADVAPAPECATRHYPSRAERRAAERATSRHPSRAERRAVERATRRRPVRQHTPRWIPRAAVLGALGAATIVAPLAGFAGGGQHDPAERPAVATVPAGETVLDALDAAATNHDAEAAGSAAALLENSSATARALVQSSRSVDRDAAMCTSLAGSGANGAGAAALGGERVVMPLVAGSYTQSSLYGNRVHPINGTWSMHAGLDFAAPLGTDIHSVADGVVVHAGEGLDGRSSMLVIIEHEVDGVTFYSWYVHMYADGVFVTEGQQVRAGEVIGEVGNNGNSTGPHLHLEIHLDDEGATTDPGAFLADHDAVMLSPDC